MKRRKNLLATIFLSILLVSLTTPVLALPTGASDDGANNNDDLRIVPGTWYKLESDIVTVLFPADGKKPIFIWWYTGAPDQVYVVKFQGLIEYFAFDHPLIGPTPEYYKRAHAWHELAERLQSSYFEEKEDEFEHMGPMMYEKLRILREIMIQINATWHRPFFPFNAGTWSLSDVKNITADEKIIGVSFTFKLVKVPEGMSGFKFAENNTMIRVRFYNATVEETVPVPGGTNITYNVSPGEMKMDLVINKWVWNIDSIKELIARLQNAGIDIKVPEGETRLALWVNLASINITNLAMAQDEPEEIEEHMSIGSHMEIEGERMSIVENRATLPFEEEERPIFAERPWWAPWLPPQKPLIKLKFANETTTLAGFFKFVSSAKVTTPENVASTVSVKAAYIAAGRHLRLFLGYPYFGNSTLEHDPSIGVDVPGIDTTPQYTVQAPSGINSIEPTVTGKYVFPLFTPELAVALIGITSVVAIVIFVARWRRKPVNVVK